MDLDNLSFATISGGAAWQAISNFKSLMLRCKRRILCIDTTSTTITATLPASPAIGDFVFQFHRLCRNV